MSTLKIRLPAIIEVTLSDSEIAEIANLIREDRDPDDDDQVTNDHIKDHILGLANDDPRSFFGDYGPDLHIAEERITVTEKK